MVTGLVQLESGIYDLNGQILLRKCNFIYLKLYLYASLSSDKNKITLSLCGILRIPLYFRVCLELGFNLGKGKTKTKKRKKKSLENVGGKLMLFEDLELSQKLSNNKNK